jgi:hypothetical protein
MPDSSEITGHLAAGGLWMDLLAWSPDGIVELGNKGIPDLSRLDIILIVSLNLSIDGNDAKYFTESSLSAERLSLNDRFIPQNNKNTPEYI